MWEADDLEALEVRKAGWRSEREGRERRQPTDRSDRSDHPDQAVDAKIYDRWFKHDDPAIVANALLCLIHQANYLLDQQIAALEQEFIEEGGYSEQLAAARIAERKRQDRIGPADAALPACPL